MARLAPVEGGEITPGEEEPGGLHRVLVGDEHGRRPGTLFSQFVHQIGDALRRLCQALGGEGQVGRVIQIGFQLPGEGGGQVLPHHAVPAHPQAPLGEAEVGDGRQAEPPADGLGRLYGPLQGRGEQHPGAEPAQVGRRLLGLGPAGGAEPEPGQIAVAHVAGVGDLTVAHEIQAAEHGGSVGSGTVGPVERFAEHIAHVDMDAFFVEVERRRLPELRAVAVVVAGLGGRGVVTSASYEARRCGIGAGMPTIHARRLCPHARFLAPDHRAYAAASEEVFAVFASFTPLVEAVSVDEAFLDIAGLRRSYPSPEGVGHAVRAAVREGTGLPASVGLAANKLLAKLASRAAKPDGLRLIPAGGEIAFLHPLPVRALWGVGEATHARLEELGVRTVGDLAALPRDFLERRLGQALGGHLSDLAWGRDEQPVAPGGPAKSVSVEETFATDLAGRQAMETELLRLADRLAARLRSAAVVARTVTLKVRFADFTTISRSHTLPGAVDTAQDLYHVGRELLERAAVGRRRVRLLGLGGDNLEEAEAPRQLGLEPRPWGEVEAAMGRVRQRFGRDAVGRARLATRPEGPAAPLAE